MTQALPVPSSIKSIHTFQSPNQLVVTGEGGIAQSIDDGENWTLLLHNEDHSRFYFDVVIEEESGIWISAGWSKNFDSRQPLILEISLDSGNSWKQYVFDAEGFFGGVWSMHMEVDGETKALYLGLYKGGIVKVTF